MSSDQMKKNLLGEEDPVFHLTFTMTRVPEKPSARPQLITLPHPFQSGKNHSRVCMFVKDPAREFKDTIEDMDLPCLAKVIGFDKLKRNYKQYSDKRALLKEYDAFLADLRIYKMLPECLGNEFYSHKKYPAPIKVHKLDSDDLKSLLNSASSSAQFMQGNGPNYSLKIGRFS